MFCWNLPEAVAVLVSCITERMEMLFCWSSLAMWMALAPDLEKRSGL
nr:hypothetical protein [Rufibacter sp. DG15C]